MGLKITVTCEEVVKPSSLTPNHLQFYPFSFLDQFAPPYYIPLLFFYENKTNLSNAERAAHLKTSLSLTLSQFYPLAGRIKKNNMGVECNDEGVCFVEAKADCKMSEILENPNSYDLNKFLSFEYQETSDVPLTVQITFFDCGGLALGVATCHKLCDVSSCFMFIKNWTAFAHGNTHELITPCFDLAKLFPPADMGDFNLIKGKLSPNLVTKRFVFSKSSLESLRERFSRSKEFRASRVEALSSFIWSRYMASKADDEIRKINLILHPMNLRSLGDEITLENMFGNIASSNVTIHKKDKERHSLAEQMRKGIIRKVDKDYMKQFHRDNKELFIKKISSLHTGNVSLTLFSSLCRLPVYELDFGWEKPSWVASGTIRLKDMTVFFDTKEGDGIEAWINMEPKDMSRFEADEELLSYVGKSPSLYSRL